MLTSNILSAFFGDLGGSLLVKFLLNKQISSLKELTDRKLFRHSKFHERRLEAIEILYGYTSDYFLFVIRAASEYETLELEKGFVSDLKKSSFVPSQIEGLTSNFKKLREFYFAKKIYFNNDIISHYDKFLDYAKIINNFYNEVMTRDEQGEIIVSPAVSEAWKSCVDESYKSIEVIRLEFKSLIGFEDK